jgi:hypothetical protein
MKTAKTRLQAYKLKAASFPEAYTYYRDWRSHVKKPLSLSYGKYDNGSMLWFEDAEKLPGIRLYKESKELIKINHTGFFCDDFQERIVSGAVIVTRWGKYVYVFPCVRWDGDETAQTYLKDAQKMLACEAFPPDYGQYDYKEPSEELTQMMRDAARWADQYAERIAEDEREESLKDRAQQYCEKLREDVVAYRQNVRELISEIKKHGSFTSAICQTLRKAIRDELRLITSARENIKELTDKPYMISEYK